MIHVELRFPVVGNSLPADHGYLMFGAVSRLIPEAHEGDWLAMETIPGTTRGDGSIFLNQRARLRMRLPQDRVPLMIKLAGRRLEVGGHALRLGIPQIALLAPSRSLYARCVTIKKFVEPEPFLSAVVRRLDEIGVHGEPVMGPRRAFRVGRHIIIGFGLTIHELSEGSSIFLQERGMGGRRHMGCGFFVPIDRGC